MTRTLAYRLMLATAAFLIGVVAVTGISQLVNAATPTETFESVCADCHEKSDYEGLSAQEIQTALTNFVDGKAKHQKKLQMSKEEIDAMAKYLSTP